MISYDLEQLQKITHRKLIIIILKIQNRSSGIEIEHMPRMREIGVRSSVGTDLIRQNR